jgi:hypothetical protein
MHTQLVHIEVNVPYNHSSITLTETFVAPSNAVKNLAEVVSHFDEDQTMTILNIQVPVSEVTVKVSDSAKAISSFENLTHHELNFTNYPICKSILEKWSTLNRGHHVNHVNVFSDWYEKYGLEDGI